MASVEPESLVSSIGNGARTPPPPLRLPPGLLADLNLDLNFFFLDSSDYAADPESFESIDKLQFRSVDPGGSPSERSK